MFVVVALPVSCLPTELGGPFNPRSFFRPCGLLLFVFLSPLVFARQPTTLLGKLLKEKNCRGGGKKIEHYQQEATKEGQQVLLQ